MRRNGPWLLAGLTAGLLAAYLLGASCQDEVAPGPNPEADFPQADPPKSVGDTGRAPELRTAASGARPGVPAPVAPAGAKAEGTVPVRIRVLQLDGSVPEKASITAYPSRKGAWGRSHAWTRARPRVDLPPGSYLLEAAIDGAWAGRSPRVPVSVERGRDVRAVLQLGGGPGLAGSFHLREPIVHQRTRVHARRLDAGEAPNPEALFDRGRQKEGSRPEKGRLTRDRSSYSFRKLLPGRWLVGVTLDGETCESWGVVDVEDRRVVHDFHIPAFDRGVFLEIHVVNRHGDPVPKVQFQHMFEAPGMVLGGGHRQLALASGSYLLERSISLPRMPTGRALEQLPEGTHRLTVVSRELGRTSLVFDPSRRGPLQVVLEPAITLSLEIRGRERLPPRAVVHLCDALSPTMLGSTSKAHKIPAEVAITLENVQPGKRLLAFLSYATKQRQRTIQIVVPVEIRPGDERLAVTIPPLRRLTITGLSRAGVSLRRIHPAGDWLQQIGFDKPDAEGRLVLEHVPDGRYELGYTPAGGGRTTWQPVEVQGEDLTVAIAK